MVTLLGKLILLERLISAVKAIGNPAIIIRKIDPTTVSLEITLEI